MLAYPETGSRPRPGAFPTLADYPHLPYTRAMVKEVLSWRLVGPLGIPHHRPTKGAQAVYEVIKRTHVVCIEIQPPGYHIPPKEICI